MNTEHSKRGLRVKLILPALTEATSPYWRPIKYSLFPPLGLATLAAYLRPDDEAVIVDEHVEFLRTDDEPDLVLIQVYITNAYRAYRIADHYRAKGVFVGLGGLHVTSLPEEAAVHADVFFWGPENKHFRNFCKSSATAGPNASMSPLRDALWTAFRRYAAILSAAVTILFPTPLW